MGSSREIGTEGATLRPPGSERQPSRLATTDKRELDSQPLARDHRGEVEVIPTGEARVDGRSRVAVAVLLAVTFLAVPSMGGPIPSKVEAHSADLATVGSFLEREEVAQALVANGLSADEVERRLARLSAEDLAALAANVDQIQSAGDVPGYIWILLAVLIGVTIVATIL
jgi:hypothetical protein